MELTYTMQGDYLIPDLTVPESPKLGKYGMLRRTFLREHRDGIYTGMLLNGTLNSHLEEVDRQAQKMLDDAKLVVDSTAVYDGSVEEGKVISTDPAPGVEVKEGTKVTMTVSMGAEKATVPNLVDLSQEDAEAALADRKSVV